MEKKQIYSTDETQQMRKVLPSPPTRWSVCKTCCVLLLVLLPPWFLFPYLLILLLYRESNFRLSALVFFVLGLRFFRLLLAFFLFPLHIFSLLFLHPLPLRRVPLSVLRSNICLRLSLLFPCHFGQLPCSYFLFLTRLFSVFYHQRSRVIFLPPPPLRTALPHEFHLCAGFHPPPLHRRFPSRLLRRGVPFLILCLYGSFSPTRSVPSLSPDSSFPFSLLLSMAPSFSQFPFLSPAEAVISLPSNSSWVCRISEKWERCADVFPNAVTGQFGGSCRTGYCCAKYAITPSYLFGDVCSNSASDCKSYKEEYSYGACSRENYCHKCAKNAQCSYDNTTNGGVWCHCPPPGEGDGMTCEVNPCAANPCTNGICIVSSTAPDGYICKCLPGFVQLSDQHGQFVRCVDLCNSGVCGEGVLACYNGHSTHICACAFGYINVKINGREKCVKPDLCSVEPCGSPSAVKSCRTTSSTTYSCTCADGFTLASINGRQHCIRRM